MANEDLVGEPEMLEPEVLSLRHERFVQAYLVNGNNATQAAVAAGYSTTSASSIGSEGYRVLHRPDVQRRIAELTAPFAAKNKLTLEKTLEQIAAISQFDKRKLYDPKTGLKKRIIDLDDETAAAISHLGPNDAIPFDKLKAVDMAMKYLGGYEKDNTQRAENLKINILLV